MSEITRRDALRRLAAAATYLYQDGPRFWYSTQPTGTKLAEDRGEDVAGGVRIEAVLPALRVVGKGRVGELDRTGRVGHVHGHVPGPSTRI